MTVQELLSRISDQSQPHRDLIVDELTDFIDTGNLPILELQLAFDEMVRLLQEETDSSMIESILNFLGSASPSISRRDAAVAAIASMLDRLPVSCLIHAIPLISDYGHPDVDALIENFAASTNPALRDVVREAAQTLKRRRNSG